MTVLLPSQIAAYMQQAGFPSDQLQTGVQIALAESSGNTDATNVNSNGSTDLGLFQINDKAHPDLVSKSNSAWKDPATNTAAALSVYRSAGNSWSPWTTYTTGAYKLYAGQACTISATGGTGGNTSPTSSTQPLQYVTLTPQELTFFNSLPQQAQAGIQQGDTQQQLTAQSAIDERIKAGQLTYQDSVNAQQAAGNSANVAEQLALNQIFPGLGSLVGAAGTAIDWTTAFGSFLSKLSDPHMWVRIGMVVVGGGMILVALNILAKPITQPIADTALKAAGTASGAKAATFAAQDRANKKAEAEAARAEKAAKKAQSKEKAS